MTQILTGFQDSLCKHEFTPPVISRFRSRVSTYNKKVYTIKLRSSSNPSRSKSAVLYNVMQVWTYKPLGNCNLSSQANTLGSFLEEQMQRLDLNNSELARRAGVSESAIRNLLKHGVNPKAKDPDPRTLKAVAQQLRVDALKLFRLVGYIDPPSLANSVRAEYLADIFDRLPSEKQDAVMGVIEALTDEEILKHNIQKMRKSPEDALTGIDEMFPGLIRLAANHLIVEYKMVDAQDIRLIEPEIMIPPGNAWQDLSEATQQRIIALIRYKLSVEYDPTFVDQEWR